MDSFQPGVSVLMTAYNAMPYLRDAVDSILNQTFRDFEFIIVNDGSKDGTAAWLDQIDDPRVRVFHEPNRGTAGGSNFGLKHCTRKYVARMDADDVSFPERLAEQYAFMESNPQVALVGTQLQIIGEERAGLEVSLPLTHSEIDEALLNLNHGMNHGSCFYRNELIRRLGGYWTVHRTYDDWDMFLRMGELGELANLPKVLFQYRTLSTSLVGSRLLEMRRYFRYAVDCARRRRSGQELIGPEAFFRELDSAPWTERTFERVGVYALNQYRIATAEICGGKKVSGYARMGWAALCSPSRTLNRLGRILNVRKARSQSI